jgi:hypothetical protein
MYAYVHIQILLRASALCVMQGDVWLFIILTYYAFAILITGMITVVVIFVIVVFYGKY